MIKSAESTAKKPYENTTFTPYIDKLRDVIEFTGKYKKDGSPKIKPRYSPYDIAVYGDLLRRTRNKAGNNPFPKIQTIADKLSYSYGTVQRALCKFENDLVIYRRHTGRASIYYFVPLKADGKPDENSGKYQTAKALLDRKRGKSDLAEKNISYNNKETKIPIRDFLSTPEKQHAARRAALLSKVPAGVKISLAIIRLWINVALKYFADDAETILERTFNSENPQAYFWKVYRSKTDTQPRQYQTRPPSGQAPPAKPQKSIAEQRENEVEANSERYHQNQAVKMDEHIEAYKKLTEERKMNVYLKLLHSYRHDPDVVREIETKGPNRLHEVEDIRLSYKIQVAMKRVRI